MKSVVVTGVSSGLGWHITKVLTSHGFHVFGSLRKPQDLEALREAFGTAFTPLIFDITDEPAVQDAAQQVREELQGETLFGLVNNAGCAVPAPLLHLATDQFRHQMDVNLTGAFIVIKAFVPLLGADRSLRGSPGRIINMSSGAGKSGKPMNGAYTASKHALEGFSESLRRELMFYGVDVVIVDPGRRQTPIWDKAEAVDLSVAYAGTDFEEAAGRMQKMMVKAGKAGGPPEKVGEAIRHLLTAEKPPVRYVVADGHFISRAIGMIPPKRFMDRVIAKKLGLLKAKD